MYPFTRFDVELGVVRRTKDTLTDRCLRILTIFLNNSKKENEFNTFYFCFFSNKTCIWIIETLFIEIQSC